MRSLYSFLSCMNGKSNKGLSSSFTENQSENVVKKLVIRATLLLSLQLIFGNVISAQNGIIGSGFTNGWGIGDIVSFDAGTGTSRIKILNPKGTGNQYFRLVRNWSGDLTQFGPFGCVDIDWTFPNLIYGATTCNTAGAFYINCPNITDNYVFKTPNGNTSLDLLYFRIQGAVRSVSSVSQSPSINTVAPNMPVTVTATLDGSLNTGQAVYLRYTTDAWVTSTVVQMTGSAASYSAQIPGASATNVRSYYVFTSGTANVPANGSNVDLYTINLNNNAGPNYNYTVAAATNVVTVTSTGGTLSAMYTNLSEAFTAVNAGTHQGAITISINGNTTEPASPTTLLQSSSPSSYTSILIRPAGGNFTINSAATPTTNRGIIELNGADNVTIDGDDPSTLGTRNLTVQSALSSNIVACIRLSSGNTSGTNGANNVTVKNCILVGSRNSASTVTASYGINLSNYSTSTMTTGAYSSLNTLIENNEIKRCYVGIFANGASSTYPNTGLIIRNNTIGSATSAENIGQRGIYVANTATSTGAALIEGNDIRAGDYVGSGYSANVSGVDIAANNFGVRVVRNNIHDIQQSSVSGWSAIGIFISSGTGNTSGFIQNNFIRDIVAANFSATVSQSASHGIYSSVGFTGYAIDHNTIVQSTASTAGTVAHPFSSCVTMNSASSSLTSFRNNILVNSISSSNAYGFYTLATTNISGASVNNNNYYVPSGSVGFYNGSNAASLSTWKTNTGKDLNGISINPPFLSSTDLHLNVLNAGIIPFNGTGATGTSVTVDYDNASRGSNPDIGADEFALAACSGTPTVSSITANPTVQCGAGVFVLTVVPGSISEYTYQWQTSTNGGGLWNPVSGATQSVYTTEVNSSTQLYRCVITCSVSGLSVTSTSVSATVSTNPTVTIEPSNSGVFCGNGTLTASGATTYVWNSSPTLSSTSGAVVNSTASTLTTYTVTGTNAAGCSSQATITVGPPTIVINSSTPLFCETGGAISLIANSSIDPDITYTWEAQTPSVTNISTSGYTLNCTISETSEFKVTGSGTGIYAGCVSYGYLSVGVYPLTPTTLQATSPVCAGTSVVLSSGISASNYVFVSQSYVATTVPATATTLCTNGVSAVPLGGGNLDNGGWGNIPLGFSFNFFGNNYSSLAVSTNGFLTFGPVLGYGTTAGQLGQNVFSNLGGTFPNTNNPGNIIAVMAGDHYLGNEVNGSATGDVYYWTEGYAPNRRFVVYYKDVNACCSGSTPTFSARVVLHETLGILDIHIDNNVQSGPNSVGVQNGSKTIGVSPTGLAYFSNSINSGQAWRMFPPTSFLTIWNQNSGSGNTQLTSGYNLFSQTVTPLVSTTYSLNYTNTLTGCSNASSPATTIVNVNGTTAPAGITTVSTLPSVCNPETFTLSTNYSGSLDGITLNWQSSLNGTSWSNISGATSSTLTTTHSTQTHYRLQFVSCGGTPSFSSSIIVGHSCGIPGCTDVSACNYNANATINDGSCVAPTTWYLDADSDGYYVSQSSSCTNPGVGYSATAGISGDCDDSQFTINPNASEDCFNAVDDNCDGNINEGCLSAIAGEEPYNALSAPSSVYSFCSSFFGTLAGAFPSTLAQSTCVTGEDRWYNFTTLSTGVTIFIGSNANDIVIELQDENGNVIDVENTVIGIGTEVLTRTGLTVGASYRVGIRNFNSNAQAGGQFSGCIRHLRAGGADSGTSATWPSTIGMCNVFKAAYCGGTGVQYRYTWTGLTGIAAGQVYTRTQTSDYLTITSVTPMLPAGSMYNVLVTAIYTIPNGAGSNEVFEMPAANPTAITISANPLTSLRASNQCSAGPRYRGAVVASLPWVCGVTNWRWRFTEVNPLTMQTVGLPIEQNRGAASNFLNLNNVSALQFGKTYAVQTSPIYSYTGTNYQWGPVAYMCIVGSAGLIVDASQDVAQDAIQDRLVEDVSQGASQDLPQDLVSHLSENLELNLFPNPSNGEGLTMSVVGITSSDIEMKIYDALGRKIETKQFAVDGTLQTELNFQTELSNGLYLIEVSSGKMIKSARILIQK